MTLTANRDVHHFVDQTRRTFQVAATKHVYKGSVVGVSATGYAQGLVAGDPFAGLAYEEKDNTSGAAGAVSVSVFVQGDFVHALAGATVADLGRPVFASADDALTFDGFGNSYVGVVQGLEAAGEIVLRIDPTRKLIKTITHAVEDLGAGADIAARAIHGFDQPGFLVAARVTNQATAAAGIDAGNTAVVALAIDAGTVVTETFDNVTTFPGANASKTLGALANTKASKGNVLTLAVTNGATADPGSFLVEVDYV